jgi:hypothetical protein
MTGAHWDGWNLTDPHKAEASWVGLKAAYRNTSGARWNDLCQGDRLRGG